MTLAAECTVLEQEREAERAAASTHADKLDKVADKLSSDSDDDTINDED